MAAHVLIKSLCIMSLLISYCCLKKKYVIERNDKYCHVPEGLSIYGLKIQQ